MQILNIIITKQKYFICAFFIIFILLNRFTEDSFTYLYEQMDTISINKNSRFSKNFYTNKSESLYISTEDIVKLEADNPDAIISNIITESGPEQSQIFYLDPRLYPEFSAYGMISEHPASYYTNSKVKLHPKSNQFEYTFSDSGSCNKIINLQQEVEFNCNTDYLVFPDNYEEIAAKYLEVYGSPEIVNGLSTYTNINKIYYSTEPLVSDVYSFVNSSEVTLETSIAEIENQIMYLKYFILIVGSIILLSSVLLALCLYGTIKNTVSNLQLIGISKVRVLLNYGLIFTSMGLVSQLLGMDLYVYLTYAISVFVVLSVLIWRVDD